MGCSLSRMCCPCCYNDDTGDVDSFEEIDVNPVLREDADTYTARAQVVSIYILSEEAEFLGHTPISRRQFESVVSPGTLQKPKGARGDQRKTRLLNIDDITINIPRNSCSAEDAEKIEVTTPDSSPLLQLLQQEKLVLHVQILPFFLVLEPHGMKFKNPIDIKVKTPIASPDRTILLFYKDSDESPWINKTQTVNLVVEDGSISYKTDSFSWNLFVTIPKTCYGTLEKCTSYLLNLFNKKAARLHFSAQYKDEGVPDDNTKVQQVKCYICCTTKPGGTALYNETNINKDKISEIFCTASSEKEIVEGSSIEIHVLDNKAKDFDVNLSLCETEGQVRVFTTKRFESASYPEIDIKQRHWITGDLHTVAQISTDYIVVPKVSKRYTMIDISGKAFSDISNKAYMVSLLHSKYPDMYNDLNYDELEAHLVKYQILSLAERNKLVETKNSEKNGELLKILETKTADNIKNFFNILNNIGRSDLIPDELKQPNNIEPIENTEVKQLNDPHPQNATNYNELGPVHNRQPVQNALPMSEDLSLNLDTFQ